MSDLYFIQNKANGRIKIGRSVNVLNRLRTLQCGSADELDCLLRLPGRGQEEPIWHLAFQDDRWRGDKSEWFEDTPDLRSAMSNAAIGGAWWDFSWPPDERLWAVVALPEDEAEWPEDEIIEEVVDWQLGLQLALRSIGEFGRPNLEYIEWWGTALTHPAAFSDDWRADTTFANGRLTDSSAKPSVLSQGAAADAGGSVAAGNGKDASGAGSDG